MSGALQVALPQTVGQAIERVMIGGDLSSLTAEQRVQYYNAVCQSVGLNPLTKPFDYLQLNGKLVLYANKGCSEQLRSNRKISITITDRSAVDDVFIVTSIAKMPDGREDSSTGAVSIAGLKGEQKANAMMKAETKSKRRVTLSICGLNMLDETEVETIRQDNPQTNGPITASAMHPGSEDGGGPDLGYRIPFGKFKARSLEEVGIEQLESYVKYLRTTAEKKGETLKGQVLDFIDRAEEYIEACVEEEIKNREEDVPF